MWDVHQAFEVVGDALLKNEAYGDYDLTIDVGDCSFTLTRDGVPVHVHLDTGSNDDVPHSTPFRAG